MRWAMATIGSTPTIVVSPFIVWSDRKSSRTLRGSLDPFLGRSLDGQQTLVGRDDELVGLREVRVAKLAEIDVERHPGSARGV